MQFQVWNRQEAESHAMHEVNLHMPHLFISFYDTERGRLAIPRNPKRMGHHEIGAHDIEGPKEGGVVFTNEMARRLLAFVGNRPESVFMIVVSCEAGISRSSAAAAALSQWINNHDSDILNNPRYAPNQFIYNSIMDELKGKS